MTDAEIHEAAERDPDARPLTDEEFARAKRVPRVKTLRRALGLTQEEFSARYRVPLGILCDGKRAARSPTSDQPARTRDGSHAWDGIAYICPSCDAILGVEQYPSALRHGSSAA